MSAIDPDRRIPVTNTRTAQMPFSKISGRPIAAGLALVSVIVVAAACSSAGNQPTTPPATPVPTVAPSDGPVVVPSQPVTTPAPSQAVDGVFSIALEDPIGHAVTLDVKDATGSLVDVRSGKPGDGMSVRWGTVKVENVDAQTLRVVWVGLPRDEAVRLGVSQSGGKVSLAFTQAAPPPYADALGVDLVVVLRFADLVRAEDVRAAIR
jgi:hypothetical protein